MLRRSWMPLATVAVVAALVVVLAFLEYRWTVDLGSAERERLRRSLEFSAEQTRDRLQRVLAEAASGVVVDRDGKVSWTSRGELARDLYRLEQGRLEQYQVADGKWKEVSWPEELQRVRDVPPLNRPFVGDPPVPPEDQRPQRGGRPPGPLAGQAFWVLQEGAPALISPTPEFTLILTLDANTLWKRVVPDLLQHEFDPAEFAVGLYSRSRSEETLYETNPTARDQPDYREGFAPGRAAGPRRRAERPPPGAGPVAIAIPSLELRARHVRGSLDNAASDLVRRNLALGLGILVLLAVAVSALVISTQRAHKLAAMQMDFVAGISHELRTPLAVITSAAENLADGVVDASPHVKQYGGLIRKEARHLTGLIEETLAFAAQRSNAQPIAVEPADVRDVVTKTLAQCDSEVRSAGVEVNTALGDAPLVAKVNAVALSRCIQNLISNALKYGGEARWLAIEGARHNGEVQLAIRDRGPGIDKQDLPHIFDPFFRGRNAAFAARGTGLGLNLVKSLMEEMKGSVSVQTSGQGTTFTLHLPAEEA